MLSSFLIMLREGVEAALIVGIIAAYLRQTGRAAGMPAVWCGVILAAGMSLSIFVALQLAAAEFPQRIQELFEAIAGFIAVCLLMIMVFWMRNAASTIKKGFQRSIDMALTRTDRQGLALGLTAFLAVAREGLESAFFLLATFQNNAGVEPVIGALLGLACSFGFGIGIYYGTSRINIRLFFHWTGVFVIFVAAGLVSTSLRSLHEAGLWNHLQDVAFDLSGVLPKDSSPGTLLSGIFGYHDTPATGEIIIYLLFLLPALSLYFYRPRFSTSRLGRAHP